MEDSTQKPRIRWPGAQSYFHSSRSPGVKRDVREGMREPVSYNSGS